MKNQFDLPPLQCSQGGFAYNGEHIEYWKARALEAEGSRRSSDRIVDRKWPRVFNVKRSIENSWHGDISFARFPTDDELQALEILLRDDHLPAPAVPSTVRSPVDAIPRCEICDWPLAESREKGCVPGDCSYRPDSPAEQERIRRRRAAVSSTPSKDQP